MLFDTEAAGRLSLPVERLSEGAAIEGDLPKPGDVIDLELPREAVVRASMPWYVSRYPWGWLVLLAVGGLAWWWLHTRH
jgi:hypothetical protein